MIERIGRLVRAAEYAYLTVMVIFSVAISVTGVFSRYVLGSSLAWVEEIAGFVLVGVITVGASVAIYEKKHIRVEILPEFVSSLRRAADLIANSVGLIIMMLLLGLSIQFVYRLILSEQKATSLPWLYIGCPLIMMPVGYLMGSFRFAERLLNDLKRKPESELDTVSQRKR